MLNRKILWELFFCRSSHEFFHNRIARLAESKADKRIDESRWEVKTARERESYGNASANNRENKEGAAIIGTYKALFRTNKSATFIKARE